MSVEGQLWREVCQHLQLEASAQRIAAVLAEHVPLDALVIQLFSSDQAQLTTVACGGGDAIPPWPSRTVLPRVAVRELRRLAKQGTLTLVTAGSLLAQVLLPTGLEGAVAALPVSAHGELAGIGLLCSRQEWRAPHLALLSLAIEPLGVALENDRRASELARMRAALEADREALLTRLQRQDISEAVIGETGGLRIVMERVEQVAPTDAPVLILGETGSGKEVIARAIHQRSSRSAGPVVRVNCGAIPPELVDSELFGHERGSFTGAVATRKGWFERADGGSLFLDEIGELPPAAQVRLLRVLQDQTLERVGGHKSIRVDVRIVAATHRHLESMVSAGSFREDLWYRLSVFPIRLPALRERTEDVPALAAYFADGAGRRLGGAALTPSPADLELLRSYAWPGNVRELAAVIERAAILGNGKRLELSAALGAGSTPRAAPPRAQPEPVVPTAIATLDEAMRAHIGRALSACGGRIEGSHGAAAALAINPHTLRARMRKLGIDWTRYRER